jgi:pimeloyl-ACP methyl ester carboxylesterase
VNYFSGFGFCNESVLFPRWIPQGETVAAGFSYGAQKALAFALQSSQRIDRLVLLSPAFFNDKNDAFVRLQLKHFKRDPDAYRKAFVRNVAYPSKIELDDFLCAMDGEDLEALLTYKWRAEAIETLRSRGVSIEVFLGEKDRIIDAQAAFEFFSSLVTTYLIKDAGHLLTI